MKEMSFLQLMLLSASVPKYKSKKDKEVEQKPVDFTTMMMGKVNG